MSCKSVLASSNGGGLNAVNDDALLDQQLRLRGLESYRVAWDEEVDWSLFTAAVLRSPWDYVEQQERFSRWLTQVATATQLLNTSQVVRWNIDKRYLGELAEAGFHVLPTRYVDKGESLALSSLVESLGWKEVVVKPVVSASSRNTHRLPQERVAGFESEWQALVQTEAMMVQPFRSSVLSRGEVSLVHFAGEFSHAVLKRSKTNDFRVQEEFGGEVTDYRPTKAELELAGTALDWLRELPVYARVDLIMGPDDRPEIIELELIEPELWLRRRTSSPACFADAIVNCLSPPARRGPNSAG